MTYIKKKLHYLYLCLKQTKSSYLVNSSFSSIYRICSNTKTFRACPFEISFFLNYGIFFIMVGSALDCISATSHISALNLSLLERGQTSSLSTTPASTFNRSFFFTISTIFIEIPLSHTFFFTTFRHSKESIPFVILHSSLSYFSTNRQCNIPHLSFSAPASRYSVSLSRRSIDLLALPPHGVFGAL